LWGFDVLDAADGLQGVEKGVPWKPDVALVDIGLPKLDGFEVARRLRQALGNHVFLIALTAYSEPECRSKAFSSGFDMFLNKPANLEELHRVLGEVRAA
jgi:CheY-like chemotaxis protein